MSRSLIRVLRLRTLLEEQCRLKLETLVQEVHRVERIRDEKRKAASASRALAFFLITEKAPHNSTDHQGGDERKTWPGPETWMAAVRDGELADLHHNHLQRRASLIMQGVEASRGEMLKLRGEKQQAETLLRFEEARREIELERRQQRNLDDWYAAALYRKIHWRYDESVMG
jgi:hypothetical protein